MKKRPGFSVLFTSILMVLSAVSATWAEDDNSVSLTQDETDGSYYVNMPYVENTEVSSTLTLTVDDIASLTNAQTGAVSFKVYDNGGKSEYDDGNYTGLYGNYARSTLIIDVPENFALSLSGQIYTENLNGNGVPYDYLNVYDGTDNSAGILAEHLYNPYDWLDIGPFVSTGNAMTLYFYSDNSGQYPGLDLTVTLVPVYNITVNGLAPNNGELTGLETASEGANVTLTATPSEGYVFVKAVVIDGESNPVSVTRNGNNISFTMPASNVTVTPYFADPTVVSFDENGCLNNGTYFHVKCESEVCTITQQLVDVPNEDGKDFMCWTEMVQYIEFYQDLQTWTIALGGNLNLGGYDEENGKCRMAFTPFGDNHAGFNGNENTIEGFCYVASSSQENAGFFGTFSGTDFKDVTFDHAYVKGYNAGVAATTINGSAVSGVTIKNATLLGVNLGGLAYSLSNLQKMAKVSVNTITMNTDGTGMPNLTIESTYIGGLAAKANGTLAGAVEGLTISNSGDIMGARFGGLVGSCAESSDVTNISGAIVTSASIDATGATSGIAGGIVGESGSEIHVSFSLYEGSLTGGTVGGIIGDAFKSKIITVDNTYSYGAITSSEHAGYIVGWMSSYEPIDGSDALYNNYHFGEDNVVLGVGLGYTADTWAAGSSNVYANVRNDNAGSLTASGTLGYHLNEYINNGSLDGSYMDFFEGAYDDNYYSLVRTANGIATDAEVSSPLLAALMNYNLESTGLAAQWQYADGKVTFGTSTEPNHLVVVQAKNLTQMQKDRLGTTPVRYEFRNENGDPTYSGKYTVADGFYGYTDAEGKLDDDFLSNVEGLMSELGTDAMLLNESGEIVSIDLSEKLNSYHILTATAASTYEVVYKYCATTCTDFDAVTTTALAFLTPKVESYVDKENAPLQLVPNVVSFYEEYHSLGSVLKFSVVLQDADGNQLDFIEPQTPDRSEIWSFQDIADKIRAKGISGVAKIVLEYRSLGWPESGTDFPMITVAIEPENWDYEVGIYGYDKNSSMVQVIESSASVGESMTLQYGAGIKANEFGKSRGYNLKDTYSLTYQYTTSVDNGCNKNAGTGKWFGTVADLAETMTECGTAEWTIDNLVVGESGDLVILDSVKMASYMAQKISGNTATEKLTIVPDYTLVEYNVSFNLNLPTVYDGDNSSVFLGRSWSPSKVMTVEGPNFPKVYSSRCPAPLAEVWSPTADPTEMPEWYFSTEYYVNHVSRNFLNYAAAPAGADSSTIAYVYWNDCSVAQTIPLVYAISVGETQDVSDNPAVTVTLKQTLDATQETPLEISHPMENVNLEQGSDYTHRTMIPVADDTLSFVVNFATKAGYEISGLNFVTTDSASPAVTLQETGETVNLGLVVPTKEHPGDTTLTFNDRIYASMQLNVTLGYVNYEVNFARPVGDNALTDGENSVEVFVPDDMVGETYIGGTWADSKTFTLGSDDKEMPKLYAMNGCVAWSYTNPYNASDPVFSEFNEETAESFGSTTGLYPVYMTEADNPSYCTQPTTGYVTVTANVAEATMAHLVAPYVELWQIIGSGATADTIRHTFDQDDVTETLFTLRVPSIARSEAVSESYVPFTFEIHAVTAEGYAAYSESYYTKVVSEDEGNTVETNNYISNITVAGSDVEFYVGALIGGESYTVAFKPENWDRFWTDMGEYNEFKYNIYIADEDRNLPEVYQLGEIAQKLPVLYAATIEQCSSVQNCAGSYVIAGWTIFADSAYCVADRTKSESEDCIKSTSKNLFTTFSGNLIATARAAAAADEITINDDVLYLYPVWRRLDGDGYNTIQVGCPNCADAPMVITLSQTFSVAGQNITLTNSSVDYSHRGYYSSIAFPERWRTPFENFTMDVSFTSNPGYAVESITLDESVSTGIDSRTFEQGLLKASDKYVYAKFIPDEYSFVPYTVTFDIESLEDSIVAFGQSWMNSDGSRSMDVGPNNGFPKMYVLTARDYYGKFNEAFWTKEVKTRDDFEDESGWSDWYWSYVGASMTPLFTSKLVTNVLGENSSETEMTLYPLVVSELADNNGARNFWRIMLRSDDDTDPNSYHGSVVISQTWNGKTYSQKSDFSNAEVYLHALFVPNADDTLVYDVSLAPDPGYTMSLTSGSFGWTDDDGGSTTVPEDEGWGFNLDDPDAMTLKVQPSKMSRWTAEAYVSYTPLHYNVRYSIPEDSPVFVANKLAGGVYSVDWNDTQSDVTVEDLSVPPPVYVAQADGKACRVESWKMSDAEGRTSQGLENEVAYMTSIETDENFVNALIPTLDTVFCDSFHTLWQTLSVEGQGTILLEQVLNVTPENEGDPTEIVVKHSFVEDESGDTVLLTPSIHANGDGNWSRVGVKLRVVAIPAEGYTFDPKTAIKYERNVDGNHETVVVEDSSFVNVMWPLSWKVKFTSLAPIYVTYDLSMESADDSANTYLPTNAKKSEMLELASNEDVVPFWTPYRTDLCFEGWSTKSMMNRDANDPLYKEFRVDNFADFSTNSDNPTTLYAIWGANCSAEHNWMYVINGNNKTTLTLYQLFGSDTLFHEVSNRYGLSLDGKAFDLYVDPARSTPNEGYHYVEDAAYGLSYTVEESAPVTVAADQETGVWHLSTETIEGEPTYTFDIATEMTDYTLVFDVNADDATVFYGTDWVKEKTLNLASTATEFPVYQRRTDACFDGWAFASHMAAESFRSFGSDFLDAVKSIMPTIETVLNDEGEEEDRTVYRLYAQWDESCEPQNYTVSTEIPAAQGSFRIVQVVDGQSTVLTLDGDHPLTLPKDHYVEYDTVKFVPATGYTLAADAEVFIVYSREDENFGVHTFANGSRHNFNDSTGLGLTTASLEISGLNADAYELVFVDNTGEAEDKPFLGDSWADFLADGTLTEDESGNWMLKVGYNASSENKGFPIALYRNGQCLAGYTFAAGDNTDGVYKELSDAFLLKLAELENPVTLYPYWEDCENVYTVTASDAEQGVLTLTQKFVKGETEYVRNYIVEDGGIALSSTNDVTFKGISFAPNEGSNLVLDAERAYSYRAGAETEWADLAVPFTVTSDMEIKAPLLLQAEFALDAGYDDVFYGPGFSWNWSSEGVAFGAALPSNLYRAGYKLAGWKFDNEETPMLNLNEDFATAYNAYAAAHEGNYPDTLHAVWTVSGVIPAYSLQLTEETLEQNAGVLTLSQTIGDSTIVHVFEDGMLDVPMVEDLALTVNFAIDTAHSFDGETPITLKSIITDETVGSYATGDEVVVHTETLGAAGTVMVNVATKVDSYEFAFDINVGEDDQVFYGKDWFATKSYDMSEEKLDSKFPTSAYQTQNCLGGFAFTAMEPLEDGYTITMPDVKFYTGIDSAFIADYKALEEKPTTLYAVWLKPGVHCSAITSNVMISALNASEEGEFTLTNADMEIKLPASEETAAVQVPVAEDLEFTVTFTPTSAYDFDAETGTITISLVDGYDYTLVNAKTYSFAKNATLKATPTLKAVAFDLNANAGEASVFYGKEYAKTWNSEGAAYGAELPKNIYRTDANFLGWAFTALEDNATEGFFTKFDKDFMDAYAAQETVPTTLYAVWKTNAERATYTITSTEETLGAGNLVVAQWAFADSIGYAVGADGLKVPAENNLIFRAYFEPLNTHSVVGDLPVALDVDGEVTNVFVGQDFVLAGNTEITVATENDVYVLAFDANADGATLFYGDNWFSGKTYSPADAEEDLNFPTSLYRTDKCLDGFAFNADESVVYKSISDEFITEFKERELTSPVTLVAVWKNCPETYANYTVAAKDASEGVFTLTNKYGEIANEFEVGSEALVIPAAEDLTFSVTFAENVTVDYENKVSVLAGDETVAMVADGATVSFSQNSELKAVASVLDLTFAFDANKAANDTVFYNSEWSATKSYDLADEEFDYHFPTAYQTSKCLAGFAFSKTATESEAFQEVGTEFIKAYKALEVKPTTLYAVWTTEDCNHGYVVLRSGNTEAEGSFTISDAVNSYELSAGSLMAVPTHVVDFKVTFHEGHAYELENIDLLDDDLNSYSGFANGAEYSFDMNTVLKANVEPKSKGLVFALNADDATVFYGTSYDPKWFENLMNGDFYNDNLPSGIYRNDAVFVGWSFTQMSGVAEGSKYFTKIDDDFYEAFKNHAETRENFDTPDTLYAVWKSAPNREIYTVTVGNKASEGKFRLTNASGGLSNEFLVDATTRLVIPAENDLVFTVSFVSASETAEYEGISVISTTGTQIAVIEMGDEYTFRKDVMLRAISYMPTMEFALDVNAGNADVFYESDFGFKWWASSYGQNLPTGIYRTDAKLVGWSLDKNATPDKAFKEIDDAFNEAVESYMEHYGEDLIGDISEGDFDLSKIQEMYGMDFAQMSRGPVLYAVWEKANVKTVSVKSNSLRQGTLTLQQLVDDSTFTFVVGEKGLKVPYVEGGLEFRAHFEANESHLLNSGKSLVWNAAAADTTKNDEFVLVSEATSFDALVKVVGFNLAFNAESKETLFYGDDWTSGKKVIAKGTSASQFPTMVYSASRCLVGWTLKTDAVAYTEMQDELANKLYEKYPKLTDTTKINMYALWSDSPDQCSALMTRVSVEQDKGEVMLVEKTGESTEVVHKFNEKGSMMLPSDIVSAEWTLRSAPDSSYALDSLTIVRNDKLLAVLREGGNLPGNMDNAVFKAHFSKANKTPVEIVERHFAQSGNAIQLNIKASEFEVTRGVEARVRVFDVKGDSVVLDSLLGDSVAMGFESEVVLRMKRTGDYKVVLTLEDEKESDAFEQEFGVKSSIAPVGKDGWQMVSLAAVDTSAINWTSDDQVFYWWDEFGNGGDYWQYRRYNRGDSVVATRGAWYSSLDSLPLVLKRDIEDDGEDAVWKLDSIHSGWNLVANTHGWEVSLFAGHADEEKDVDEESEISFYRYNSETADYEETKYLKPYEAVWAKVGKKKNWKVSAAPVFAKATEREPQPEKPEGGRMLPKRVLAKASTKDRWVLQAVLSDKNGKQDAWNILGAGNNPFSAEEPPESMGDHVNLSIVEGKRALAKSIKSASDEMEWTVALSASNDRVGYLTLVGIDDVNAFGYRVFVTVDGNTTEMKDGVPLQVLLKSNAKTATVRVAPAAKVVAQNSLKGLRSARLGGKLKVSFEAAGLAGTNARVDLLDMKGHVMSTVNAKTLEGTNALVLDAPKSGLYMLRVRAGSQQQAAKVMVK